MLCDCVFSCVNILMYVYTYVPAAGGIKGKKQNNPVITHSLVK